MAHRKRDTILANRGRHRTVLRATRRPTADGASTEFILRCASERYLVSLDAAADTGDRAVRLALDEHHNVRVAHAAYQRAMSLVWAERLDGATECLESQLEPYASLAANRWVAWADFIAAALLVRSPAPDAGDEALQRLDLSATRFGAEALIDGVVSVDTARLTARRRAGRRRGSADDIERLRIRIVGRGDGGRFYARPTGSPSTPSTSSSPSTSERMKVGRRRRGRCTGGSPSPRIRSTARSGGSAWHS